MLIIGIVLAMIIGLARYVNQRSNLALARSELEIWNHTITAFVNRYGRVPDVDEQDAAGTITDPRFHALRPPGFAFDDPWQNAYHYERLSDQAYRIFSAGPDGTPGTEDDVYPE